MTADELGARLRLLTAVRSGQLQSIEYHRTELPQAEAHVRTLDSMIEEIRAKLCPNCWQGATRVTPCRLCGGTGLAKT